MAISSNLDDQSDFLSICRCEHLRERISAHLPTLQDTLVPSIQFAIPLGFSTLLVGQVLVGHHTIIIIIIYI